MLRVTVRNRSDRDATIHGPGTYSGVWFEIYRPNGGVWPKGDGPVMGSTDGTSTSRVLHPGEVIEIFGPAAAMGAMPGTWTYPAAETIKLRAGFFQDAEPRYQHSEWVQLHAGR